MGLLGDVLDAASGIAGSVLPGFAAGEDLKNARNAQKRQAGINERQYRNRYQWQMEDMRLAGLNPILSYKQGAPGMPGVGGYSSDFSGAVTRGITSSAAMKQARTQERLSVAQIQNVNADTRLKTAQQLATDQAALLSASARQLNEISAFMAGPDLHGTSGLMEALRAGGEPARWLNAANRARILLGLGYSPGGRHGGWGVKSSRRRRK